MEHTITNHARKRVAKRMGIPKKAVDRQFQLALEKGYHRKDLKGRVKKYLDKECLKDEISPKDAILYNNFCFLIGKNNVLITVYPIPGNLSNRVNAYINEGK